MESRCLARIDRLIVVRALWLTVGCLVVSPLPSVEVPAQVASTSAVGSSTAAPDRSLRSSRLADAPASEDLAGTNATVTREYKAIMEADDAAQDDVERIIRENEAFAAKGAGVPEAELRRRCRDRLEPVRKAYEDFVKRHPGHAPAQVAYAAFLGDLGEEEASQEHLERALTLSPRDPAIYNNLANVYGHIGPVKKAFEFYAKAIDLNPLEPVYYHNFGTTVFLFRKDAMEFYHLEEPAVFQKALNLYSNAMRLDPDNFPLASDVAQTYYGIRPLPIDRALASWTNAFRIAHDEAEREGVQIHFARLKLVAGRFSEVQAHLNTITNTAYTDLKNKLARNLQDRRREVESPETKAPQNEARAPGAPKP